MHKPLDVVNPVTRPVSSFVCFHFVGRESGEAGGDTVPVGNGFGPETKANERSNESKRANESKRENKSKRKQTKAVRRAETQCPWGIALALKRKQTRGQTKANERSNKSKREVKRKQTRGQTKANERSNESKRENESKRKR
jgi:hypothetical protein